MPPISRAPRRYFIEFNAAVLLYLAAVIGRARLAPQVADPTLHTIVLLSPIVAVLLAAAAVVRFYRGMDEYHRLQLLESLAIAAGVTGVVAVSWGFLEDVGFPHLSLLWAWIIIAAAWAAAALYRGWQDKVSEGAGRSALVSVAATLLYVAIGTGVYALIGYAAGLPTPWYALALVAAVLFIARMGCFIFARSKSC